MHETLKSLPKDPPKLRAISELMAAEIKPQAYQIEKLKKELAAHRKARFGSKSETMDQLAFDLQEDAEIAAPAQKTTLADDADETTPPPSAPTVVPRYRTTLSARKKCCSPAMLSATAGARSSRLAKT